VTFELYGGGGNGTSYVAYYYGGGGAYCVSTVDITNSSPFTITVGAGGADSKVVGPNSFSVTAGAGRTWVYYGSQSNAGGVCSGAYTLGIEGSAGAYTYYSGSGSGGSGIGGVCRGPLGAPPITTTWTTPASSVQDTYGTPSYGGGAGNLGIGGPGLVVVTY
jgi:hypothetical protein